MTLSRSSKLFLLVHTMTITENDYVAQAQFFHVFTDNPDRTSNVRLLCKRMRVQPRGGGGRNKLQLQRLRAPNLKTIMKRKSAQIKHHLRTIHLGSPSQPVFHPEVSKVDISSPKCEPQRIVSPISPVIDQKPEPPLAIERFVQLTSYSTPQETSAWLTNNRFGKYIETFESFSGADMLRMTREDLMQICGQADGIRLYNSVHLKSIAPKLKIYVCREKTSIFNAIFLSSYSNVELMERLAALMGISQEQVRDIYMEGPQSIHVQLNDDLIRHIKEETMFTVEIMQENGCVIFLLKRTVK